MTTPDPKTCPFCGKSLRWSDLYREYDHPVSQCLLAGKTFKKAAITTWNTRAPLSPAVLAELPEVRALVKATREEALGEAVAAADKEMARIGFTIPSSELGSIRNGVRNAILRAMEGREGRRRSHH